MAKQRLLAYITQYGCPLETTESKQRLNPDLANHFQDIRVVAISKSTKAGSPSPTNLRKRLLLEASGVQQARSDHQYSFNAIHQRAFLSLLCRHFSLSSNSPFGFVRASRAHNPTSVQMVSHFQELMHLQTSEKLLRVAGPLMSSAMVLDSRPPGAHGKSLSMLW